MSNSKALYIYTIGASAAVTLTINSNRTFILNWDPFSSNETLRYNVTCSIEQAGSSRVVLSEQVNTTMLRETLRNGYVGAMFNCCVMADNETETWRACNATAIPTGTATTHTARQTGNSYRSLVIIYRTKQSWFSFTGCISCCVYINSLITSKPQSLHSSTEFTIACKGWESYTYHHFYVYPTGDGTGSKRFGKFDLAIR